MHFCILRRNSRWPPKVAGKRFLLKVASRLFIYPVGPKFRRIALSCTVSEISVFTFHAEIQDGRQKWRESDFCRGTIGRVENFDEIPLSRTVKEIEPNFFFSIFSENSKWWSFLGSGKSFENWQE